VGLYPIFVDLARVRTVVIGGGVIAEGKIRGLLATGADVTVVSPTLTAFLADTARDARLRHRPRTYRYGDLDGMALAFAATGDSVVNAAVAAEGKLRGVWVNAADDPANCDFILPAVLRRGALTVAVSTGGASPAVARTVKEELERHFGDEYTTLVEVAGAVRRRLRAERRSVDAGRWSAALADPAFRRLITAGEHEPARQWLRERLECL
jgi:precorrin-2 dehydrogenase/sirohydrochlorin ferrochelatase